MNIQKGILLFLSSVGLSAAAQSHHLTAEQAMQRVGFEHHNVGNVRPAKSPATNSLFYIFDLDSSADSGQADGGFIIASADDRARAILGRCDNGTWDPDNIPPALQGWLESMSEALQLLAESDEAATGISQAPAKAAASRVEPLLQLKGEGEVLWGQNTPFNNLCPASGTTHSATGCAATAMAQIMRYYRWPEVGHGSNTYTTSTIGDTGSKTSVSDTFDGTLYDWDNMLTTYYLTADNKPSNFNDTQAAAVATLMRHIGVASDMDYNTGASGTTEVPMLRALTENFDYDRSLQIYYRENYSSNEWYALLQGEIDAQRPVLMNGYSISGGHAFVIDGYDTTMGDGYFHFNWGWNGMSNGFYSVDICDPGEQGTGGSLGGYSYNQNIFAGIQPQAGGSATPNLCVSAALRYDYGQLHYQWLNRGAGSFSGQTGYVIEDGALNTFVKVADATDVAFRSGSGNVHHSIAAPTKAGLRYYLASAPLRNSDNFTAMRPMIGSPAALVSVEDGQGGYTLVPETAGLADLEIASIAVEGDAYAGTTLNFSIAVTNKGKQEYNGALYICLTDIGGGQPSYEDHASDNPLGIYLRPGETNTYSFPYYGTPAAGTYMMKVLYNPRNGSDLLHIAGQSLTFDVVPYGSHDVEKNPPIISISKQSLSATTVEQGSELSVNATFYNKGGIDPINVGAAIFADNGNKIITTLGVSSQSIVKEMSDHTFTGTIDLAPGRYRMLLGYEDNGTWEYFGYSYLYFTVVEPKTEPEDPESPDVQLPEYDEYDVMDCDQDFDGDIDTDDLGWLVQDVLDGSDAKDFPWDDLNHDNKISIGDIVRFIYIMNCEAKKAAE